MIEPPPNAIRSQVIATEDGFHLSHMLHADGRSVMVRLSDFHANELFENLRLHLERKGVR